MNFLILLDSAPSYYKMLSCVGEALRKQGHSIFYAIDAPINLAMNPDCCLVGECRIFSEYLARYTSVASEVVANIGNWEAFIADFDRYQTVGVNTANGYDWYARIAGSLYSFFTSYVADKNIHAILYEGVTNSYAYYANLAAENLGAIYIGLQASRLPGRHEFHDPRATSYRDRVRHAYEALEGGKKILTDFEKEWIDKYMVGFYSATPDYMETSGLRLESPFSKYLNKIALSKTFRTLFYSIKFNGVRWHSYRQGSPAVYAGRHVLRWILRWARSKYIKKYFDNPSDDELYYLYPLHFHPEASTSISARWYVDEYPVIKNLAMSLPFGRWLYVKDHPSAVGFPSVSFYRTLSNLPNVRLVPPNHCTKSLIQKSLGIITLTSTVGYEALVLRKPVLVLGEVFYDFHPGCKKIGWGSELIKSLRDIQRQTISKSQSRLMVEAYYSETLPGSLPLRGEAPGTATFEQLAEEIIVRAKWLLESNK